MKEHIKRALHPERLKKLIDWLAYGSLVLDICITIITLSSMLYPADIEKYLGPVNILLSIVVILSVASALMIIGVKVYEEMLFRTFMIRMHIRNHVMRLRRFDWIRNKMFDIYEWRRKIRRFFGLKPF